MNALKTMFLNTAPLQESHVLSTGYADHLISHKGAKQHTVAVTNRDWA